METVTLNDGTVLDGHCIETENALFVYLTGMTLLEGVVLFSDAEKTSVITEMNHEHEHVYTGYTRLSAASDEYGNCNLVMRRESNA